MIATVSSVQDAPLLHVFDNEAWPRVDMTQRHTSAESSGEANLHEAVMQAIESISRRLGAGLHLREIRFNIQIPKYLKLGIPQRVVVESFERLIESGIRGVTTGGEIAILLGGGKQNTQIVFTLRFRDCLAVARQGELEFENGSIVRESPMDAPRLSPLMASYYAAL